MLTVSVRTVVGAAAPNPNRSLELVAFSVPATNRLMPSSWVTENVSATVSVNLNSMTVACAKPPRLKGLVKHAPVQVAGVGEAGELLAKKPGIVLAAALL